MLLIKNNMRLSVRNLQLLTPYSSHNEALTRLIINLMHQRETCGCSDEQTPVVCKGPNLF